MKVVFTFLLSFAVCSKGFSVVNGRDADPVASAATVFIHLTGAIRNCTGVIVSSNLILTAGHCTEEASDTGTYVSITNSAKSVSAVKVKVRRWNTAPGYRTSDEKDLSEVQKDFAYIITTEDLLALFKISRSQLPKLAVTASQVTTVLSTLKANPKAYGYGIYDDSEHEGVKKELSLNVTLNSKLNSLRAVSLQANVGICQGDSGGGLFATDKNGTHWLLGNVSGIAAPNGCGSSGSFAEYAALYRNACWLQKSAEVDLGLTCN